MRRNINLYKGSFLKLENDKYRNEYLNTYTPAAFDKIREDFNLPKLSRRTGKEEKLKEQRENFSKKYICPVCGCPQTYLKDTNVMVCANPECNGIEVKDKEGSVVGYNVPYRELTNRGEAIASSILD